MGIFNSVYNMNKVKTVNDLAYIIQCDIDFYKCTKTSTQTDTLEKNEEKKQMKIDFFTKIVDDLMLLKAIVSKYKKKPSQESVQLMKVCYVDAKSAINSLNVHKYTSSIEQLKSLLASVPSPLISPSLSPSASSSALSSVTATGDIMDELVLNHISTVELSLDPIIVKDELQ